MPVVNKDPPPTAKSPRLVEGGVHSSGGHSLAHSSLPPVPHVRQMEGAGQNGMRAGERLCGDKCILQDVHTDRPWIPGLAHALNADDGIGFLLIIEGEGQRARKFAGRLQIRERRTLWQGRGLLR